MLHALVDERAHQRASATAEAAPEAVEELDHVRLAIEREIPAVKIRNAEEICGVE